MRFEVNPGDSGKLPASHCAKQVIYQNVENPELYMVRISNDYVTLFHTNIPSIGIARIIDWATFSIPNKWVEAPHGASIKLVQLQ